jgi:hypothetical protein
MVLAYLFAVRAPNLTYVFLALSILLSVIKLEQNLTNCFLTHSANLKDRDFVWKEDEKRFI